MVRITSAGNVGIGNTAPGTIFEVSKSAGNASAEISSWSTTDSHEPTLTFQKSGSATINTLAATADDERIGKIYFNGVATYDGGSIATAGQISVEQDAAATAGATPGRMMFFTSDTSAITERMRISSGGQVVIGSGVTPVTTDQSNHFQILGTDSASSRATIGRWSADASVATIQFLKSRNATVGSSTIVQDGDNLGQIAFHGDDGTDFATSGADILVTVDGTPGANDMPAKMAFRTTADGASSPTSRMVINSSGRIGIGTATPLNCSLLTIMSDDLSVGTQKGGLITLSQNGYVCSIPFR